MPFTDALNEPDSTSPFSYWLYYESVHWIKRTVKNQQNGKIWYQVLDDKWNQLYYVLGEYLGIILDDELAPLYVNISDAQKRIEVHLNDQLLFAYENDNLVIVTRVASGEVFSNGAYNTPTGSFITYHKRPTRHIAAGDITADGYDLPACRA